MEFRVGDRVACHVPGSWVDDRAGVIEALDVEASDGVRGHVVDWFRNRKPLLKGSKREHLQRARHHRAAVNH